MSTSVAIQFDDDAQQRHAAELGMWVFLATEVLFFGGLFTGYTLYRMTHPTAFAEGSRHLYMSIGAVNTGVLLISSWTMALAVHTCGSGAVKALRRWLWITASLGCVFLALKGVEYSLDYHEHLVPGVNFQYEGPADASNVQLFMVTYYIMTGLHALHMLIGVGCVGILSLLARRKRSGSVSGTWVEMVGLYWHFVDIVWIFLFPLLYLI